MRRRTRPDESGRAVRPRVAGSDGAGARLALSQWMYRAERVVPPAETTPISSRRHRSRLASTRTAGHRTAAASPHAPSAATPANNPWSVPGSNRRPPACTAESVRSGWSWLVARCPLDPPSCGLRDSGRISVGRAPNDACVRFLSRPLAAQRLPIPGAYEPARPRAVQTLFIQ